jgi:hypothetical protein
MSRRLRRLWSTLERVPDLAAVPREWCSLLGDDHEAVARFLLPTRRIAGSVKSTSPGRTCIHEIRKFKGEYLEVCPDGCETATRSIDEVTVRRLDVAGFAREIAESLGLETLPTSTPPTSSEATAGTPSGSRNNCRPRPCGSFSRSTATPSFSRATGGGAPASA